MTLATSLGSQLPQAFFFFFFTAPLDDSLNLLRDSWGENTTHGQTSASCLQWFSLRADKGGWSNFSVGEAFQFAAKLNFGLHL